MLTLLDFLLHVDTHLLDIIAHYGSTVYVFLFLIIFVETGLVVVPFLPGDSLLFVAGAFCASGVLSMPLLMALLIVAAIIGDATNYTIGKHFGLRVFTKFIKKEHLAKTEAFYEEYGKKTIIIARFVPIIRTLAPFVAGIGRMNFASFFKYNVIGGIIWVVSLMLAGYIFGRIPFIKENLTAIVIGIVIVSILPALWHVVKKKKTTKS